MSELPKKLKTYIVGCFSGNEVKSCVCLHYLFRQVIVGIANK